MTPPLTRLYVYLTEGCNCACRHCWLAPPLDADGTTKGSLPVDLFEQAVAEAKPLGLSNVKLTGGEPLIHPRFLDLLAILRREGLSLSIETNGLLLTPGIAEAIALSEAATVSVSIDGTDDATHDGIRGVADAFDRACAAVRHLAAAGLRPQVIMTLLDSNFGQAEEMVRLAGELGAASLKYNVLQPAGRGESMAPARTAPSVPQIIDLGRRIETELAGQTELAISFDHPLAFRPMSRIASDGGCSICGILNILGLLHDGSWALCGVGAHIPELVFGKVGTDDLTVLWRNHPILDEIRSGLPDRLGGVCSRCVMRRLCLGACIAQNHYRAGDLFAPFWFCEEAERLGLFPESRLEAARRALLKNT